MPKLPEAYLARMRGQLGEAQFTAYLGAMGDSPRRVITSYSIHYTKLYELYVAKRENAKRKCEYPPVCRKKLPQAGLRRITSYNVCYTKLLRPFSDGGSPSERYRPPHSSAVSAR